MDIVHRYWGNQNVRFAIRDIPAGPSRTLMLLSMPPHV